ncbi:hypothetical protein [Devosia sp.]|uniref:hypothetical protein n=1 Tax=Devosia sp. TaxID=1871048 RepID=UPI002F180ABF
MKHSRSSAEVEIRDAVVARLRELRPDARIVHELNVDEGMNRVDVAAIGRDRIVFVEIKSERDKPHRLARQLHAFGPCCHALILAAHEKWFASPGTERKVRRVHKVRVPQQDPDTGMMTLVPGTIEDWYNVHLPSPMQLLLAEFPHWGIAEWQYPPPDGHRRWELQRYDWHRPWADKLLHLLWRNELVAVCDRLRVACSPRAARSDLIAAIVQVARCLEIEAEVCHALRGREFAEADAPIVEGARA